MRRDTGDELPPPDGEITVRQRESIPFRELARVAIKRYPRRAFLGLALFIGQAFLYNAVVFDLGTLLHEFFAVGPGVGPLLHGDLRGQQLPRAAAAGALLRHRGPDSDDLGHLPRIGRDRRRARASC